MRKSRTETLYPEHASTHMMWKCHNKDYYLLNPTMKQLYMDCIKHSMEKRADFKEHVKIHSYCVMSNHYHQLCSYENGSQNLSKYMRYSHGIFGARYNRRNNRCGKVAYSRPKTPLIEDLNHEMWVQFYIEANPIRAGICTEENLKSYKYCSYRFYAYGIKDEYTRLLTLPQWYLELGKTPQERQAKYRKLFHEYLADDDKQKHMQKIFCASDFIGSEFQVLKFKCKDADNTE